MRVFLLLLKTLLLVAVPVAVDAAAPGSGPDHSHPLPEWLLALQFFVGLLLLYLCTSLFRTGRKVRSQSRRLASKNRQLHRELRTRKQLARELEERNQQYRVLFEENQSVMLLVDPASQAIVDANPAASRFYGYPRPELVGMPIGQISPTAPEILHQRVVGGDSCLEHKIEFEHRLADGSLRDVEVFCGPMVVEGRQLQYSVIHDISERRRYEGELTEKHRFLQNVIDGVGDPIVVIAPDYQVLMANRVAREYLPAGERGRENFCCYELLHHRSRPCGGAEHPCPLREVKKRGATVSMVHRHRHGKEVRTFELTASPLWNPDGSLRGIIEASRDITERLQVEELLSENEKRLQHLAHHDSLTGLPNRLLFEDRLRHAMAQAQRKKRQMALMFIDLDRFKQINDTHGHEVGDRVLVEIARRLQATVREADTVARLGGDEFLVLLEDMDGLQTVIGMAQRIRTELGLSVDINQFRLRVTGSLGISMYPGDADCPEDLLKCADIAMYHAKQEGKDNYKFYTPRMNVRAQEMYQLEQDMRFALQKGQFSLCYQPQVELQSGRLIGVEALVRWRHPQHGMVPPKKFLPLAEESGLVLEIGEWVLREACRQQVAWQGQGYPSLRIAVNLSGRQLRQDDFIETVDRILAETGIRPDDLELEINENIIMGDVQATIMALTDLRTRGVRLSVDDFGTGYSSLSHLNIFPLDRLKIDLSLVARLADEGEPAAVVDAVIGLGRSMNLEVIAEGVETQRQAEILKSYGCEFGQGFLFSRPIPEAELRNKFFAELRPPTPLEDSPPRFNFPELDS